MGGMSALGKRTFAVQTSCPLYPKSGHLRRKTSCPLYPQKQTCAAQNGMSALPPIADLCSALARVR